MPYPHSVNPGYTSSWGRCGMEYYVPSDIDTEDEEYALDMDTGTCVLQQNKLSGAKQVMYSTSTLGLVGLAYATLWWMCS
eukprot:COSAG02_NODE_27448_length_609_cov_1.215686_2_plen_80_part_00